MPQVPVYQPQVREAPLQGGFQQAPDTGADTRALAAGTLAVSDFVNKAEIRDAQAKAYEVEAQITSDWLKWDAENRAKFRGANADGYTAAAEEWWKNSAEAYGKDLDPRARMLASRNLTTKRTQALGNVIQFVGVEKERHADEAYGANAATTAQFGVTTGDLTGAAQRLRQLAAETGARKGWTTEQVQAEQLKQLSGMHLANIAKLAEADPTKAQAYYDANKGEVLAANQPRVEEVLRNEGDNQFATKFAAENAALPLDEQLQKAAEIQDPKRREKTLQHIKNNYAMVREAQRAVEEKASDAAWQLFAKGQRIPEAILSGMNGRERVQLQEAGRTRADRLAAGRPVKTDMNTYIDLRERLAAGEKVDLRGYTEKIGQAQMEQLLDIQTANKKGGAKQDSMLTDEGRINAALVGLGIDKKKKPEEAGLIVGEIDRRVRAASAAKGDKPLSPDEKQKIVDGVVMDKVYVNEWGSDPEKPVASLTPDDMAKAYVNVNGRNVPVSSVPRTDRTQIISALRATGQAVTEQNIVKLYLEGKKK